MRPKPLLHFFLLPTEPRRVATAAGLCLALLVSCSAFERLAEDEAETGRGAEAIVRVLENPSVPTLIVEGTNYLVYALTVLFGGGAAAIAVRNKRSNRRKDAIEALQDVLREELDVLDQRMEKLEEGKATT